MITEKVFVFIIRRTDADQRKHVRSDKRRRLRYARDFKDVKMLPVELSVHIRGPDLKYQASEFALRSAGTLLSRVRALPLASWPEITSV
ncbi:hypothetical protein PoB_001603700 [Plakobranchus ocellatus]|uniref:Uncharacterized protein n=1 Tax=Plakobranchus ocellatus TaxID=259542 RepID=A0AAV3Z4Q4_9GAST|nr:hypothetical protein PoB_001603700 [Plakobranchus ocellatus]